MNRIRKNAAANLIGRGWTGVAHLAATPVFIHFVGIEGFGVIGFYLTLIALSNLFDLGFSSTINRVLARSRAEVNRYQGIGNLVRSIETLYLSLAFVIGFTTIVASRSIARWWLDAAAIPEGALQLGVVTMGVAIGAQWPVSLYSGGLLGMERQVLLNVISVIFVTLRVGGAIVILWLVSPTLSAFFLWQSAVAAVHVVVLRTVLQRLLPIHERRGRFQWSEVRKVSHFAGGVAGVSMLALVFTQGDKLILSRMLSLEAFGYYSLAALASSGISYLVIPIFEAVYPRFSSLVAQRSWTEVTTLYHRATQAIVVLVAPPTVIAAFFGSRIVWAWTGSADVAKETGTILAMLAIGTALNGFMNVPYALMLADGWTSLPLVLNLGAVLILGPALVVLAGRYGAVGAAGVWIALNAFYLLIGTTALHRRLLRGEHALWVRQAIALPAAAALVAVGAANLFAPDTESRLVTFAWLTAVMCGSAVAAASTTSIGREVGSRLVHVLSSRKREGA